jgi:hypothetical protein
MAEWFKAAVLKTAFLPGNGGSNPSPSAITPLAVEVQPWMVEQEGSEF